MGLSQIILKAKEQQSDAYLKYSMSKSNVTMANAVQYYMDISNILVGLIKELEKFPLNDIDRLVFVGQMLSSKAYDNTIDLDAYGKGLTDMCEKLMIKDIPAPK